MYNDFFIRHEQSFRASRDSKVKGRLKTHISFWEKISANEDILNVIRFGYKIPFLDTPDQSYSVNNKSAIDNMDFVESSISEMLANNYIVQTPFIPHVVNPLSVSINKQGKKWFILDLRLVNKHIWKEKISFEDWKVALDYFEKDSYCFKFDLSKGYYHLDIFPQHQTFLGFSVKGKYYCFTVIPFGLSCAPFIFTKTLREMVKYWRFNQIKIVMFLDDGWGTSKSFNDTYEMHCL